MAFPTVEDRLTEAFSTAAASHDVSLPATVNVDDLLLMFFGVRGVAHPMADPSGWTRLVRTVNGVGGVVCYGKKADGTEGGTTQTVVPAAPSKLAARVMRISGWGGTVATDIDVGSRVHFRSNPDPGSVTAGWGSDDNLFIAAAGSGSSGTTHNFTAFSAGYSHGVTVRSATTMGGAVGTCERNLAADNDNPSAWTSTGGDHGYTFTMVIKPGVPGPSGIAPLRRRIEGI